MVKVETGTEATTSAAHTVQVSPAKAASRVIAQGWDVQISCHPPRGRSVLGLTEGWLKQKGSPSQMGSGRSPCPHLGCRFGRSFCELGAQTYEARVVWLLQIRHNRVCLQVFLLCIAMWCRATTDSGEFNLSLLYASVSCSHILSKKSCK